MNKYFVERLIALIPLFLGITLMSFWVIHLAPGGPVDTQGAFNPKMTVQAREKLAALYGLDKPVLVQYTDWMRRILRMDFGHSFVDGEKVTGKIGRALPVTLAVNLLSLLIILGLGIPLGILGALRPDGWVDKGLTGLTLAGFSIPTFWLALVLMQFFGVGLRWLPVSGLVSVNFDELGFAGKSLDLARHLVLPLAVSALTGLAGISRYTRASLLGTLRQNYIRTARAKGLDERRVLCRHALRNALLPVVTLVGLSIPGLLGGSVIFESLFSIPGLGRLFYNSVLPGIIP